MKKQSQDLTNEQLHIDDAAAAQDEYSREDIMNEFGGWSKRSEPRTPPLDTAQTLPEQKPEQSAPAEEADAPDTKIVRFPAQAKRFPEEKEEKPPKNPADFTGQTIRFTPIREEQTQQAEKPKIWTYQAEPDPEPAPPSDPKEAKKAARRAQRAQKEAQKRRRQLERHQKQQAKRAERRKEQPEREFSDCRAAYAYYAQGTFQRLRLFVSILLALVSIGLCYAASYPIGSYDFTANAESFSRMLLIIMVVQAFVAWDVALRGVRAACRLRYDHAGMLLVLTIACAVDAVIAIRDGRIAFCPAVTLQWCAALLGEYSMQLAKLRTLKAACSMNEPKAAVREEKAWHGEDCIFRSEAKPEEFVRELEIPDAGSRMMRIYAPVLTAVTLGLSVLSMLQAEDSFLWAWTALMIASFPAGMFLSMHNQNGRHYGVDTFRRYEGGGLGAEIRGDVILMGSLGFMKLMRVHMPEGARVKQAVYLSVNGELAAVFALSYAPATNVKACLQALARCTGLTPILATRDFMITPQFLKHRYKLSPDRIEFPTVEERARLSSPDAVQEPRQGALLARTGFSCFSMAVAGARAARSAAIAAIAVTYAASVMGLLVLFFLTFIGSTLAVSAWNLWLIPELLITSMTAKR